MNITQKDIDSCPIDEETLVKLVADLQKGNEHLFNQLNPKQREWIRRLIQSTESGDMAMLEALYAADYDHMPVDPHLFFTESDYLRHVGKDIYKEWWPHLLHCCEPSNRIIEPIFTGAIGLGKCQRASSLVTTEKGFLTIEELVSDNYGGKVQTEDSSYKQLSSRHSEGRISTTLVRMKAGHELEGSHHHRYKVLRNLEAVWVRSDQLIAGDVVLGCPASSFPSHDGISQVEAELAGWFTAEGSFIENGASFSVAEDEVEYVYNLACAAKETFPFSNCEKYPDRREVRIKGGAHVSAWVKARWGADTSHGKGIPRCIREGTLSTICAYMKGLFSGDAYASEEIVQLTTMSWKLAEQVGVILNCLGIYNTITKKKAKLDGKDYGYAYNVTVCSVASKYLFANMIGFAQKSKRENLAEQLTFSRNSDHWFSIKLSEKDARALRDMQPTERGGKHKKSKYGDKKNSPKGLLKRVVEGQGLTISLLRKVMMAGGRLPKPLKDIAEGNLMFGVVESTRKSTAVCYDLSVVENPSYISNGFVSHNTHIMMAILIYKLYRMICLKNPARFYKLASKTAIVYGIYSITLKQAHDVGFYVFRDQMLEESPFFRYVYPRYKSPDDRVILPKGLHIITGSSALHAIGRNLFAIVMDELNYLNQGKATVKKAHDLTSAVTRRLASRFKQESGELPGLVGYISSKRTQTDFLESRIKKRKEAQGVYVVDGALWEFSEKIRYCGKKFRVSLGDDLHEAQILDEVHKEHGEWFVRSIASAASRGPTINVPVEHYEEFEDNPYEAIRDVAGIATSSFTPFFPRKKMLKDMIDEELPKAFDVEEVELSVNSRHQLAEYFKIDRMCTVHMGKWVPMRHLNAPRYIHIDLSKNQCRTGFCMVHPSSHFLTGEVDEDGHAKTVEGINMLTVIKDIEVDLALAIKAGPNGEEIDYQKIRNFIIWLRDIGFWIRVVTFDSYQSVDSIQLLRGLGFTAEVQSMDRTAVPYKNVRQVVAERRVQTPENNILFTELSELEYDVVLDRVAKQEDGSKDVADGFGGATYQCLIDKIKPTDVPVERRLKGDDAVRKNRYDKYLKQIEEYL